MQLAFAFGLAVLALCVVVAGVQSCPHCGAFHTDDDECDLASRAAEQTAREIQQDIAAERGDQLRDREIDCD